MCNLELCILLVSSIFAVEFNSTWFDICALTC